MNHETVGGQCADKKQYCVFIARFPGDGWERNECATWLMGLPLNMKADGRVSRQGTRAYSDTPITMTRNRAVLEAQKEGVDYLLMVDSDMGPDYQVGLDKAAKPFWDVAWNFLMERREAEEAFRLACGDDDQVLQMFPPAVIGAPYCGPPPDECVYVFHWHNFESDTPNPNFKLEMINREDATIRSGIQEVAALPTGLIIYDMRLFEYLAPPWFEYEYSDEYQTEKVTTEDVFQTRNASMIGVPLFCAWDCWARHWKTKGVGRPQVIFADHVHDSLAEGLRRGWKSTQKLHFAQRPPQPLNAPGGA